MQSNQEAFTEQSHDWLYVIFQAYAGDIEQDLSLFHFFEGMVVGALFHIDVNSDAYQELDFFHDWLMHRYLDDGGVE